MQPNDTLSPAQVRAWPIPAPPSIAADRSKPLFEALALHDLMTPNQVAGRHWSIGCVALEITQRCNLDCTLCYLSDMSEAVQDLPLEEVFRRVDTIHQHYGPGTNVQITGGDPTLRKRGDLVEIVARVAAKGMRPALFTNGIKATRGLLTALRDAGLKDVAFHVDMTQERKGFANETALNAIREDYIARAHELGLHILFNTTVFDENIQDVPMLAAFFRDRADKVHLASFQMQADTGRGVLRARGEEITQQRVMGLINQGAGLDLGFDHLAVGHASCNRYGSLLSAGDVKTPTFDDARLVDDVFEQSTAYAYDRYNPWWSALVALKFVSRNLGLSARILGYVLRKVWALKGGLIKLHRPHKLTYYIHNFMDAQNLDKARCESCIFMTMTRDGPIAMCVHNARRDDFILAEVETEEGIFQPLIDKAPAQPLKKLKGRRRAAFLRERNVA